MSEQHRATPEQWDAGEALYRFAAWLVARDQPLVISGHHDASPLVDLLDEWLATHGIEKPRPPVRPPIQIATPEQWQQVENWVHRELDESLRPLLSRLAAAEQRISKLEGNSSAGLTGSNHPAKPDSSAPTGSLVAQVNAAMDRVYGEKGNCEGEAEAAILACADWLDSVGNNGSARELRQEVDRHA